MADGFDLGAATPIIEREDEGQCVRITGVDGSELTFGDGEPVTMTVSGTYSKRYRKARNAQIRQMRSRRSQPSLEDIERDAVALHAECVSAWAGFFEAGKPLDCTKANVLRVLEAAPWIHEQVVVAMEDHAGFFANSSAS
jgi:hypothetical protein